MQIINHKFFELKFYGTVNNVKVIPTRSINFLTFPGQA